MLQYTTYRVLTPLAAAISIAVILYAWRYRDLRQIPALIWLVFSCLGWLTCNIFELSASTERGTIFWAKMGYLFVTGTALAWVKFAVHYIEKPEWLKTSRFIGLCILPLITVVLVFTNEMHRLVWDTYAFLPVGYALAFQRAKKAGQWAV